MEDEDSDKALGGDALINESTDWIPTTPGRHHLVGWYNTDRTATLDFDVTDPDAGPTVSPSPSPCISPTPDPSPTSPVVAVPPPWLRPRWWAWLLGWLGIEW